MYLAQFRIQGNKIKVSAKKHCEHENCAYDLSLPGETLRLKASF